LAVIFRQRWEGFQILAGNPQAGSQPARGARKARGKPFQPTVAPAYGRMVGLLFHSAWAAFINKTGSLDRSYGPPSLPAAIADRALAGAWNQASCPRGMKYPRMGMTIAISNALLCGALATAGRGRRQV